MTLFLLPPRLSGWCLAKADTMSPWCHEAVTAEEMLRNAGGHGSKIRRKHWKEKKWHFNYTIDTRETLLERKKTKFFRRIVHIQKTAFSWNYQSAECTLLLNAPKLSYTLLTLIWWLPLFQVSGESRQSGKESSQETARYNIPLSGTTRLDSLSSSVANGEFRWYNRVSLKSAPFFLRAGKPGLGPFFGNPEDVLEWWMNDLLGTTES